ncbi:MAG: prohibitin family protein [Opitutales bacterium]|nr:prohibitin family protein [Opitutales bacterium]
MKKFPAILIFIGMLIVIGLVFGSRCVKTIEAGNVGVATLFGDIKGKPYGAGLHFVNPLYKWTMYDIREQQVTERANMPSQDQLQTQIDVSVVFNFNGEMASAILGETGDSDRVIAVHMIPSLRSLIREQGKSITKAEDLFLKSTQERLQSKLYEDLRAYLEPKGIIVNKVFIRDINLPQFITRAIESKKEREQEVQKQKAELERFRTEQQQKIALAEAEREAAEQEAIKRKVLADAQAYEIEKLNTAIAENPAYIQLQALEALKEISKNPSSKVYFINGDSPTPLPLMNMGEPLR